VWSLDGLTLLYDLKLCNEKVRGLALNGDHTVLAVACGDGTIRLFDVLSMREFHRIEAHSLSVNGICFHPHGNYLLSGGKDAHIKIWSTDDFSLIKSIPAHNYAVYAFSFSPDLKLFASASRDKTLKIWDATTFEILQRIDKEKYGGHLNSVNNVLWMENGFLVSTGDDRSICVWKVQQ
jgi:WD40 repeat protein